MMLVDAASHCRQLARAMGEKNGEVSRARESFRQLLIPREERVVVDLLEKTRKGARGGLACHIQRAEDPSVSTAGLTCKAARLLSLLHVSRNRGERQLEDV